MEEKEVFSSSEEFLVGQICNILKNNNITYVRRNEGVGDYLTKTWGYNTGTKRIFVSDEDYEKALELVEMFRQNTEEDIPEELKDIGEEEEQEIQEDLNKAKRMRRIMFLWAPLTLTLVVIIGLIISGIFGN